MLWFTDDHRLGRKEPNMMTIGGDYHRSFHAIAFFVEETGGCGERELNHSDGEAERFYRDLQQRGIRVRVGMDATGYSRWFERLLAELGFEVWMGDPAEIRRRQDEFSTIPQLAWIRLRSRWPSILGLICSCRRRHADG